MIHRQDFKMIVKTVRVADASADAMWFQESIRTWLSLGWELHGSLTVASHTDGGLILAQALIRKLCK